jgi:hypothetical protein
MCGIGFVEGAVDVSTSAFHGSVRLLTAVVVFTAFHLKCPMYLQKKEYPFYTMSSAAPLAPPPGTPYSLTWNTQYLNVEGVKADLAAGVDPNALDTTKDWVVSRPIREAVYRWDHPAAKEIVKLLLKAGADPNLPNPPPRGRSRGTFKTLSVQDAVYQPELMRLLLLDPDTKFKVDPSIQLLLYDPRVDHVPGPPRWPTAYYPLREYVSRAWSPPVNSLNSPYYDKIRDEILAMVDKAIHNRAVGVKKALNQTSLPPDVLRIVAEMDSGPIPKPQRPDLVADEPVRGAYGPKPKPAGRRRRATTKGKKKARKTRKNRK